MSRAATAPSSARSIHGAIAAAHLGGNEALVKQVKTDFTQADISPKLKALLVIAGKVQQDGKLVTAADVEAARKLGATDLEIHDTVLIAAAFCMYNRYVDGLGTVQPDDEALYRERGRMVARNGYVNTSKEYLGAEAQCLHALSQLEICDPGPHARREAGPSLRLPHERVQSEGECMPHIKLPEGYPGISAGFTYRPETAKPMRELADILLHQPNSLTPGERELIATYVSSRNCTTFCVMSHGAAAASHLGDAGRRERVKADFLTAPISMKLKALLMIAGKVQQDGKLVMEADVVAARAIGATDIEIHDTVLIAAAFSMYNRYVDGLGTVQPTRSRNVRADGEAPRRRRLHEAFDPAGRWRPV